MEGRINQRPKGEVEGGEIGTEAPSFTSAVPEVIMGGRVVLAEPLEDEFVVQQAVQGPQEEHIEGQVANSLLLKVSTQSLHLPAGPEEMSCAFKLCLKRV